MRYLPLLLLLGLVKIGSAITLEGLIHSFALQESSFVKKTKDITLLIFTKTITQMEEDSLYELVMRKGEKFRVEKNEKEEPIIIGERDKVWALFPSKRLWPTFFRERVYYPLLPQWSKLIPKESEIKETERIGDHLAYKVEVPEKWKWMSPFSVVYVDSDILQVLRAKKWDGTLINYSDFREVIPGVYIPFVIEVFQKDFLSKREVKMVEMDKGLPDAWFDPENRNIELRIFPIIREFKER